MRMPSTKLTPWALALATLALAGCETLTPAPKLDSRGAVRALPAIKYDDYCSAQRGIAEHNSRVDTLKSGKRRVYKAPCDVEKKPEPDPAPAKKELVTT